MRPARFALALAAAALASPAFGQDAAPVDPLAPLKDAMAEQDHLVDAGKAEAAVAAARERVKDGTAESWYLLGRALGNVAVTKLDPKQDPAPQRPLDVVAAKLQEGRQEADALRLLDEAATAFDKSQEAGGLTYAPAHVGRARVARFRFSITARRIDQIDPKERAPFVEDAKHDLDLAIREYRAALQLAKTWKEAALELAQTLWERQLRGDAEYVLYQFLIERPKDPDARILLGMLKMERDRLAEAEPEFRAVLAADPDNHAARKCLAQVLLSRQKYSESAEHWEVVRQQNPKDDEAYIKLFHVYLKLGKKEEARKVLTDVVATMPGSEAARRAKLILDELEKNPAAWDAVDPESPKALVAQLDSPDPVVVQQTLEKMRGYKWPSLPGAVYRLLLRQEEGDNASLKATHTAQRLAAVRLILDLADPQTLTILEILLAHPKEREPDAAVRAEVAHAISSLPSDAVVPVLFEALEDADPDVREWAVQGIAARTGKYFRKTLETRTADADWPPELKLYRAWWASTSASEAKRLACVALSAIYGRVEPGSKARVARYTLPALGDASAATWSAAYELFGALTAETLGWKTKPANAEERQKFAADAQAWLEQQAKGGR